jgi:hypothetical protein
MTVRANDGEVFRLVNSRDIKMTNRVRKDLRLTLLLSS